MNPLNLVNGSIDIANREESSEYLGQHRIADTIGSFLGLNQSQRASQIRDQINQVFTEKSLHGAKLSSLQVFKGLPEWVSIIDGKYLPMGPLVFDHNLHFSYPEKGYLASIQKASDFASKYLDSMATVGFYQALHHHACAHFDGRKTNTQMGSAETGKFLRANVCETSKCSLFLDLTAKELEETLFGKCIEGEAERAKKLNCFSMEEYFLIRKPRRELTEDFQKRALIKIGEINKEIARISSALGVEPIAYLEPSSENPWVVRLLYKCRDVGDVVEKVFKRYSTNILRAKSSEEKIECIAEFFQTLEWIHPFQDGQGRTDLLLLATELTKWGLNPPILEEPYISSFCLPSEWVAYLKKGIQKWQTIFAPSCHFSPTVSKNEKGGMRPISAHPLILKHLPLSPIPTLRESEEYTEKKIQSSSSSHFFA